MFLAAAISRILNVRPIPSKLLKVALTIVLMACAAVAFLQFRESPAAKRERDIATSKQAEPDLALKLTARLKASGWQDASAQAVVGLNLDRYRWLRDAADVVLEREFKGYEALLPDGEVAQLLERHPQMAGVLILAHDPAAVAQGIFSCSEADDQRRLIGSFAKYTEPADVSVWAAALSRHGRCIAGLLRRCQAWPVDALFLFPTSDIGVAEEYSQWLNEVLDPAALPTSDDETLSLIEFILSAGPEVRRRMIADPSFRQAFRGVIWPTFKRCVERSGGELRSRSAWELFATTPHIWDLLERSDGEALFQRVGMLAADLLYGGDAVLPELREKAAQLLLLGNQDLVERGFGGSWSRHPQFRRLMLERHLSDDQILAACTKLAAENDPDALLGRWNQMRDAAVAEDIGPPPEGVRTTVPGFAIYYAGKKLVQGRAVGWGDAIGVAGDAVTLFTLGGGKVLTESGKQAANAAVQQKLRQEAVKDIARLTSRELAEQASKKELGSFVAHHALRLIPAELKEGFLKAAVIDITQLVKGSFTLMSRLGIGRESFKKIMNLEARVFMREDAKVFVSVPSALAGNNRCAQFLNATAMNASFDAAARTQPAQDAVVKTIRVARDQTERWQQNLACWWSGHATGAFDDIKGKP